MNNGEESTTTLYAWLARDLDGIEGIVTVGTQSGLLPLVCTDRAMALSMSDAALRAGLARASAVSLVQFDRGATLVTLKEVDPPTSAPERS